MNREPKFANIYTEMYARGATVYCSNYYENQSNRLIIILNQSNNCYSLTSISNKTVKTKRTVINQNVSEIFNTHGCYYQSDFYKIIQRERASFHEIIYNAMNISDITSSRFSKFNC